ncbi:uncharacterized protein LOC132744884 [Ruditapes philippinarum]|uniref:uncharacterized protein LOC132744884 n=1 Tax=Ruditapes philippinarum TaxID=129788 RepID=UPI00295B1496|nr:uncharacterized protein LOC132744884 [Ruditapes philippinarum]
MSSSLANAKKDVVAKGEPTELPPNQGGGADAEITRKQDIVPNEEPTDLTLNQGKSGKRTSKQEENITENETEFSVTQAKDEGDTDANRKPTEFTPNQGAETDANDKCADRTQKKRNEKGGELTEPSKGANDSKCLEESPHAEHKNPDSTLTIQTVIDTNEGLLIKIEQLEHKIEDIANDRDEKEKGIEEFCKKDIESQTKMFTLREELKALETKHEREMKERNAKIKEIEKENNKYKKKDADNEKYKRSVHERINSMSKEIKQRDDNIKKQNEEIKQLNGTVKQLETRRQKYENESKSEIQTLIKNIAKLKAYIKEIENTHKTEVYNLNTDIHAERQNRFALTRKYNDLVQRLHTVEGERHSLTEEKKELLLRLSKVAGANLTYNNPNIADLSDEKRPTKLAEEFSELYDNEWTDVFEELDFETEKGKTNFMLDILKRTNAICSDLSNSHTKRIKDAFCRLTTTSHNTLANVVKQSKLETMEVVPSDQKETKVESVDNDMDLVKEGNNVNNESHDDDEQIDKVLKNKFELEETIEKQDKTDSCKVTESIEMSVQSRENNLEQVREAKRDSIEENKLRIAEPPKVNFSDESKEGYLSTVNADQNKCKANKDKKDEKCYAKVCLNHVYCCIIQIPEAKHDNKDKGHEEKEEGNTEPPKKSELEHSNTEGNPEENEDETGVETPEAPIDESIEGHLNTDNADQNKCKTNEYKKDEIPEAKHDNKDKGHEEKEEGNTEPPKDERTAVNSNMLSDDKNESKANKDKNYEKSKVEQNNMDDNPGGNKEETEVKTSEQTITTEEAHHAGTDKETEKRIEGNALQPKQDAANENANEFQSNGTSGQQHDNTDKPPVANQVATPESPIKDKTDSDAMEAPEATHSSMDDVTETTTAIRIESDFELLQKEQKKTIMDAKNFFENQLAKEVETTVADIIGKAFHADSEKTTLKTYIQKCVNICWSMYRHNPPVFIELPELKESTPFDTNKYKPYTSSGKFIDYIVWPALYLHEDGPLLCKGVAQGLGNKKSK